METRPLTLVEQRYTYASSTQIEGQTGTIGHLRGDFATTGYGFYTTWFDTRPQWKSDEFKAELDTVINALREAVREILCFIFPFVQEDYEICFMILPVR